jgi:hypothetical protein
MDEKVNLELRLISKIILDKNFRDVLRSKMTLNLLSVPEARAMFKDIWVYYHNPRHPGKTPTKRRMRDRHPGFIAYRHGSESIPELCEQIREEAVARQLIDLTTDIKDQIIAAPYKTLEKLRSGVLSIQSLSPSSRDMHFSEVARELRRKYELAKHAEGITGVPWPWERLNQETGGMLPEEFILLYGRLKSMKTFVACLIAAHAYYWAHRRVLFYSAEMSPEVITQRIASAVCQIDYKAMKDGHLNQRQEEDFYEMVDFIEDDEKNNTVDDHRPALLVTSDKDGSANVGSVSHVRIKAEEFSPDLIIVDSYYRLRDDRTGRNDYDWKVQAAIAQDLKHLAQQLRVPVLGVSQANRTSVNKELRDGMEDASYTDAGGQETDLGLRVVKGAKDPLGVKLSVVIAAAREIDRHGFVIHMKPFTRCTFRGWLRPPTDPEADSMDHVETETVQYTNYRNARDEGKKKDRLSDRQIRGTDETIRKLRERNE